MRILAIDPGSISAAWAILDTRSGWAVVGDVPVVGKNVNAAAFARLVRTYTPRRGVIEQVSSMPKQGVASSFNFGRGTGRLEGVVLALGLPLGMVTPAVWKKHFRLGPDKEQARALAIRTYPLVEGLERKKDAGRAEALLLAHYYGLHLQTRAKPMEPHDDLSPPDADPALRFPA